MSLSVEPEDISRQLLIERVLIWPQSLRSCCRIPSSSSIIQTARRSFKVAASTADGKLDWSAGGEFVVGGLVACSGMIPGKSVPESMSSTL
eukprot:15147757-Heterocapsa_arctica.AAC.1